MGRTPLELFTLLNAETSRLGIPLSATVASRYSDGSWALPPARTDSHLALQIHLTIVRYKCGEVYTYLKGPQPLVPWAKLVWFSYGIPRHRFLTWLVLLDRCPTRDRLIRWGLNVAPNCLLCNTGQESRNHLFFECPYSTTIWSWIANRCDLHLSTSWDDTILQLQSLRGNIDSKRLCLLATQATIYWIWSERNTRLHQQVFKLAGIVITAIDRQVRNRLQSFRHANSRASSAMTQLWFLRS
uniref:Reverse transcriptase zinc-binding domain-containing protein n=1 Tax=Brassica oleracea var. oleracea TaxID=109376 RepID=A0A0D3E0X7_BRAOL